MGGHDPLTIRDTLHATDLSSAAIAALHVHSTFDVTALDDTAPTVKTAAKVATAGSIVLTFSEPTLWSDPPNQTFTASANGLLIAGTWTCRNAHGTVVTCDADGADVLTAAFRPSGPLKQGQLVVIGQGLGGVYDTAGNPLGYFVLQVKAI